MAFTPSMVIFGRETWTVPPQLACWLLAIWLYVRWFQTERPLNLWGMAACLTLGMLFSPWSGLFLPPLIALHGIIFGHEHRWSILGWSAGAFSVAIALFAAHFTWLGAAAWHNFFERIALRVGVSGVDTSPSLSIWLAKMGWRVSGWNTPVATLLGVLVLIALIYRIIRQRKTTLSDQILIILAAVGLSIMLVFPQLAWVHHYISVFVVPYLAVASALAVDALLTQIPHRKPALVAVIALALGWIGWSVVMISIQSQYRLRELDIFARLDQSLQPKDRVLVAGDVPVTFQFYLKHPWVRVGLEDREWDREAGSGRYALGLMFFNVGFPAETRATSLASRFPGGRVDTNPPISPSFFVVQLDQLDKERQDISALVNELNNVPERSSVSRMETFIQETRKQVEIQLGIRTRRD
jgi:4-amino-4-deoxy-L-arabinose transferase-like glycosyltransferase